MDQNKSPHSTQLEQTMMIFRFACIAFAALLVLQKSAMTQDTLGSIESLSGEFDQLVDNNAAMEILGSGFTWTEGPVWIGDSDGHLLFSDIPRNSIFKWDARDGISLFMQPSGYTGVEYYGLEPGCNGLFLDHDGRLMMCEHGDRRISVLTKGGGKMTVADRFEGKRFNSPNDGVMHSSGAIYFTDPPYGLPKRFEDPMREIDFCGVYRVATDGTVTLLTKDIERPNGIVFSPDESKLYVAQSNPKQANWTVFDVQADGSLANGREFYDATETVGKELGLPDGMTVDQSGNLWATGPGGVLVLSPEGTLLGRLATGQATSNCTFGPDGYLYITADSYLVRLKTKTSGLTRVSQ